MTVKASVAERSETIRQVTLTKKLHLAETQAAANELISRIMEAALAQLPDEDPPRVTDQIEAEVKKMAEEPVACELPQKCPLNDARETLKRAEEAGAPPAAEPLPTGVALKWLNAPEGIDDMRFEYDITGTVVERKDECPVMSVLCDTISYSESAAALREDFWKLAVVLKGYEAGLCEDA